MATDPFHARFGREFPVGEVLFREGQLVKAGDVLAQIDVEIGRLEPRYPRPALRNLKHRLEALSNDQNFRFMFGKAAVDARMDFVTRSLFRLHDTGKPVTILRMAGIPADVVNASVSVLSRLAFDLCVLHRGKQEVLVVCEEAHRYVPSDLSLGFHPTRRSIARIAKEGRKYGCYLGIVTQRPAELDPTIISQCNTLFSMRLANERDQALLRSAVSDAAANLLSFVPSLGTREVLAFGEGVALPTRLRFKEVPPHQLPRAETTIASAPSASAGQDAHFVTAVLERWRGATSSRDNRDSFSDSSTGSPQRFESRPEPQRPDLRAPEPRTVEAPMLQPSLGLDPDRFSLLKKPLR